MLPRLVKIEFRSLFRIFTHETQKRPERNERVFSLTKLEIEINLIIAALRPFFDLQYACKRPQN